MGSTKHACRALLRVHGDADWGLHSDGVPVSRVQDSYISSNKPDSRGPGACVGDSCLFRNATEPYPWVQSLASSLSAGPNQLGDKINASDTALIMRTCRKDGLLLKPDRPATPIDSYWSVRAFGADVSGPKGELWTTETTIDGLTWMYAFGAMLDEPYELSMPELLHGASAWPLVTSSAVPSFPARRTGATAEAGTFLSYEHTGSVNGSGLPGEARRFDNAAMLLFKSGADYGSATFHVVAPTLANKWTILGETDKLIPMAKQRVRSIASLGATVLITVAGAPGELVSIWAVGPGIVEQQPFNCTVSSSGTGVITISAEGAVSKP